MSCFTRRWAASCWVGWKHHVYLFYWLCVAELRLLWLQANVSCQSWCVKTGMMGLDMEHEGAACRCAQACGIHGCARTRAAAAWPDPAVNSAALAIHTYHLPSAFPVVPLNARRRETPRNAQSQRGEQYASSHPEWQHGGRRNTIAPSGRAGGGVGEGTGGKGEGYKFSMEKIQILSIAPIQESLLSPHFRNSISFPVICFNKYKYNPGVITSIKIKSSKACFHSTTSGALMWKLLTAYMY